MVQQLPIPSGFFDRPADRGERFLQTSPAMRGSPISTRMRSSGATARRDRPRRLARRPLQCRERDQQSPARSSGPAPLPADNLDHALMWTGGCGRRWRRDGQHDAVGQFEGDQFDLDPRRRQRFGAGQLSSIPTTDPGASKLDWGDGSAAAGNTSNCRNHPGISPHVYTRPAACQGKTPTVTDGAQEPSGSSSSW